MCVFVSRVAWKNEHPDKWVFLLAWAFFLIFWFSRTHGLLELLADTQTHVRTVHAHTAKFTQTHTGAHVFFFGELSKLARTACCLFASSAGVASMDDDGKLSHTPQKYKCEFCGAWKMHHPCLCVSACVFPRAWGDSSGVRKSGPPYNLVDRHSSSCGGRRNLLRQKHVLAPLVWHFHGSLGKFAKLVVGARRFSLHHQNSAGWLSKDFPQKNPTSVKVESGRDGLANPRSAKLSSEQQGTRGTRHDGRRTTDPDGETMTNDTPKTSVKLRLRTDRRTAAELSEESKQQKRSSNFLWVISAAAAGQAVCHFSERDQVWWEKA